MRYAVRLGYFALISVFFISIINSCSSNSSKSYSIEGSVTPSEAGSVTPATGEYDEGAEVEVRAEANDTWMFSSWEGDVTGAENPVVVTIDDDMVFTALFEKLQYPLEVNVDGGGTIEENIIQSKMDDYEVGTEVELNAVSDEGWVFVEWQGDLTGSENPQTLTMDEEKSVTAVFERKDYPLTISSDGEGNVSEEVVEDPAKDYAYETIVELTANSSEGWEFARWEGDLEGTENPKQITIDGEKEVTAVFERQGYELTVNATGEGSVNEELLDGTSKTSYPFDSVIELTAEPAEGWTFVGWEGDLSGNENPEEITMDDNKEVTAVFERRDYALNINKDGEGTVNEEVVSDPNKDYAYETVVKLTASPANGWNFIRWEGDLEGDDNPKEITVDKEKTVTAVFEKETFDLTVETTGQGSVNKKVTGDAGKAKTAYGFNTIVELTADPDAGWKFDEWQGDLSGDDNPQEITIDGNKNVTAVFKEATYEINISTDGVGDISISPDKNSYSYGEEVEISVNPASSWAFSNWDGDLSGDDNPKTITLESDITATAVLGTTASVRTNDVSDMRITSVTGGGIVEDDGGFEITERGVCWSEDEDPDLTDTCTQDGDGLGEFMSDISGLRRSYPYHVRAYATNKAGTSFGKNEEFKAGYISHGYVDGLTPSKDSEFQSRTYKLVESNWKNGVGKIWIEKNLGSTGPVKDATDDDEDRAGWYFQFNRTQAYYHDGSSRIPNTTWENIDEKSDWKQQDDPCRAAFGRDSDDWRVPTKTEWQGYIDAPKSSGGPSRGDYDEAYNSLLRLHAAGRLKSGDGDIDGRGAVGFYWSRTQDTDTRGFDIILSSTESRVDNFEKSAAATIRCVKD